MTLNRTTGLTVRRKGVTYRARLITQGVKELFADWLSQRVLRQFLAAQASAGEGYDRAVELVADRIALGHYSFHSDVTQRALRTPDGVFALACLIFQAERKDAAPRPVTEEEMLRLLADKGPEVNAVVKAVFERSFPKVTPPPKPAPAPDEDGEEGEDTRPGERSELGAADSEQEPGAAADEEGADPNSGRPGDSSPRPRPSASSTPGS